MKKVILILLPLMALLTILNFNNDNFNFWYFLDNLSNADFVDISDVLHEFVEEFSEIKSFNSLESTFEEFESVFSGNFELDKIGRFFKAFGDLFVNSFTILFDFIFFLFDGIKIFIKFIIGCFKNVLILFNALFQK